MENFIRKRIIFLKKMKIKELINKIIKIKDWLDWFNDRLDTIKEKIGKLEYRLVKIFRVKYGGLSGWKI